MGDNSGSNEVLDPKYALQLDLQLSAAQNLYKKGIISAEELLLRTKAIRKMDNHHSETSGDTIYTKEGALRSFIADEITGTVIDGAITGALAGFGLAGPWGALGGALIGGIVDYGIGELDYGIRRDYTGQAYAGVYGKPSKESGVLEREYKGATINGLEALDTLGVINSGFLTNDQRIAEYQKLLNAQSTLYNKMSDLGYYGQAYQAGLAIMTGRANEQYADYDKGIEFLEDLNPYEMVYYAQLGTIIFDDEIFDAQLPYEATRGIYQNYDEEMESLKNYKAFDDSRKSFRDMENNAQNDNYFPEIHLIDPSLARDINNVAIKVLAMEGAGGRSPSTEEYLSMGIFSASEKEIFEALLEENGGIIDRVFIKKLYDIQDTLDEGTSKSGVAISEGSSAGSDALINSGLYSDKDKIIDDRAAKEKARRMLGKMEDRTSDKDAKNNNESKQRDKVISNPPTTPTSHYSPGASGANQNKTLPIPPKYAKLLRQHEVEKAKADRMQQHGKTIMDNPEVRKFYQQPSTPTKKVSVSVRPKTSWTYIDYLTTKVDEKIAKSI